MKGPGAAGRVAALCLLLGCAAYFPVNEPLHRWDAAVGDRHGQAPDAERSGELLLVLALSGGGMRAAAFSYGVLEELARTSIGLGGRPRRLVDEIDLISGVSGGSFTAAYYGLQGDAIFESYERRFLKRNVQLAMLGQLFDPRNWPRLFSTYFERSELAAEYYDRRLFRGATFGDLAARPRAPAVVINATDLSQGILFSFSQDQFDWICSDLSEFPVSRAVAASSAVPVLLSPVILRNYAGSCGFDSPEWLDRGLEGDAPARLRQHARRRASYLSRGRRPYIHLIDGGISDNLGVRGFLHALLLEQDADRALQLEAHPDLRQILVVVVDAAIQPDSRWDRMDYAPPLATILDAVTSAQISRYNFETLELLRQTLAGWTRRRSRPGHEIRSQVVHLSFDAVSDGEERDFLHRLPTSLSLSDESVDRLRRAGGQLLRESPEFIQALREIGMR